MGNIATWADSYRYQPGGEFSYGYHFIDSEDAPPPDSCKIDYPGDCPPEGCIVSAIANYVSRRLFLSEGGLVGSELTNVWFVDCTVAKQENVLRR